MFKQVLCKMGKSHECCGVCAHWNGERETDPLQHYSIAKLMSSSGVCTCKESSKYKMDLSYDKTCIKWEKWPDLR